MPSPKTLNRFKKIKPKRRPSPLHRRLVAVLLLVAIASTGGLGWLSYELAWTAHKSSPSVIEAASNLKTASENLKGSSEDIKSITSDGKAVVSIIRKEQEDPQATRSRRLAFQTGDDISRLIKKGNHIADLLIDESLPKTNRVLDNTGDLLKTSEDTIAKLGEKGELVLDETKKAVKEFYELLKDPYIRILIANAAELLKTSNSTLEKLGITIDDVNHYFPEFLQKFNGIAGNGEKSTAEIAKFLQSLNKPVSKKEKVFRFILESLIKSSPALLRR
jgi:hypothetical protein